VLRSVDAGPIPGEALSAAVGVESAQSGCIASGLTRCKTCRLQWSRDQQAWCGESTSGRRAATNGYRKVREDAAVTTPGPRSGEDTFDLIDDAVAVLADRPRCLARGRPAHHRADRQPHRTGRKMFAPTGSRPPRQRPRLDEDRPSARHQPRRGPSTLRPRIPSRRQQMALNP
jgi:hypothetical protein